MASGHMPSAEEEDDTVNGSDKLLWQQVLSWDYIQLCQRLAEGKGVIDDLRSVPARFETVQVHAFAASRCRLRIATHPWPGI